MKRSKRGKLRSHYEKVFPKTWPKKANQSKLVKPKCGFFQLFHTKTTSNQITKVGFLKDDLLPVQPPRWLSRPIDWMWSCPWKRMVSRLCRKETFILYIYLSIFYHVRFPGGCYSLNPNSNPQNSIHFGSQAIEKHFHLFVLPHLSESTFLDHVSTSIQKPASQSVCGSPTLEHQEVPPAKRNHTDVGTNTMPWIRYL